ncbi:carboxypeptidase-like regulatory domain-containing protein [Arcicella sp. LKC2W]|uniref:carboxypeptidase-like regulatory domain-containing protein n=1 Tax=Arcicella sp. LKC2W TaxID=2984198 RepID=UPI002B215DC2|nr:carboxypeptidase-like regulatory domain-containing protein [Arcicella sp. LKC2W]MEA5460856.1 carboxypeptidase-like regulatory domain-containing protein [Arcicella sp. LKC2W]
MNKIIFILLFSQINLFAQEYHFFKGQVLDLSSQAPIEGVHLRIGNIGTATNEKGDFLLKIPVKLLTNSLVFSAIGYKNHSQILAKSDTIFQKINLESSAVALNEVKVYSSALAIVKSAIKEIEHNYFSTPTLLRGFYREVSQDPNTLTYKYLAEAVLEVFKPSYQSSADGTIHILQSRKKEFMVLDSMQTFFNSGTFLPITFDIVHQNKSFINPDDVEKFKFEVQDVTTLDNQDVYVISFSPKNEEEAALQGKLYINTQDNAFVGVDFASNNAALQKNSKEKSKYSTIFKGKETKVRYEKMEGKYYLQSVAHTMTLNRIVKGKTEDFKLSLEFTTTDIETQEVKKPKNAPKAHRSDVFLKAVGAMDENFWGNYTTVLQNISLQEEASSLSKETFHK